MNKPIRSSTWKLQLSLGLLCLLAIALSLSLGRSISGPVLGLNSGNSASDWLILFEIRIPRTLLLILCGASLGLAGALLQGLLRNPLAEPGILGTSGSAALGSVLVIYFATGIPNPFLISLAGIFGAVLSLGLLYQLALRHSSMSTVILAGVAINALSAALIALALNLAPDPFAITEIMTWLMGSVSDRELRLSLWLVPFVLVGLALMLSCRQAINALSLGDDTATSLGINLKRTKILAILGAGIAVGACTSITGSIGFIGLIVPHLLRPFVQHQAGKLLIPSALGGILLLTVADILVRLTPSGPELKLGVVTALLGVPFFLYLIVVFRSKYL